MLYAHAVRFPSRRSAPAGPNAELVVEAERGRRLIEESREFVLVLDADDRVVAASRRAREALEGIVEGTQVTEEMIESGSSRVPFRVPYEIAGRTETLLYVSDAGDLAAYEELRAGFTAAVSHELRTPLARMLALLETALLPEADTAGLIEQAKGEISEITELIDDILFLSELESGREVVGLGSTVALPVLERIAAETADSAARAGVRLAVEGEPGLELPLRPRMIRVVATNLVENAIRYAGAGATLTLSVTSGNGEVALTASDTGHRRRRGRSAAALRALLPGRPRAGIQGNRARPRDRETRRHRRRRTRRGGRRPGRRPHRALRVSCSLERRSQLLLQPFTAFLPTRHRLGSTLAEMRRRERRTVSFRLPNRALFLALAVVLMAFAAAGCGRDDSNENVANTVDTSSGGEQLSGTVIADGSSTVGPLTTAAAEAFRGEQPDVNVEVGIAGTGGGFERFCAGETDLSNASRPIKDDEEAPLCADAGIEYTDFQVAVDALTVVVNTENDWVDCLTVDQLGEDLGT